MSLQHVSSFLNSVSVPLEYHVNPKKLLGTPGKNRKDMREFRLHPIDKHKKVDIKDRLCYSLKQSDGILDLAFNHVSPNSSKFSSYSFKMHDVHVDAVIASGANRGELFEKTVIRELNEALEGTVNVRIKRLIDDLERENSEFLWNNIHDIRERKGNTRKDGIPVEKLGEIIADIIMLDRNNRSWYLSLKDWNGEAFSSYNGASSLFDSNGTLVEDSLGANFLKSFGVDLNQVQKGFDDRNGISSIRNYINNDFFHRENVKKIFTRAWGLNYFYVRRKINDTWKVFWLDRKKLDELIGGLKITEVIYPSANNKSILIKCSNENASYKIEIRNCHGGEYPCDTKFRIVK